MAVQLCHVAMALKVTSLGGPADTQLIIEDNLIEMGREPQNVCTSHPKEKFTYGRIGSL